MIKLIKGYSLHTNPAVTYVLIDRCSINQSSMFWHSCVQVISWYFLLFLFIYLHFCTLESPSVYCVAGGLDEALYNVIAMAREQEIPFVFALGRKALGRCVNKLVPVSVVGIFNYSGAEVRHSHPLKNTFVCFDCQVND